MMMDKIIVFIFGSIAGSFLNVCIHRLPKKESVLYPPSHCPKCNHGIPWYDNIPILSFLILRGKCRFCPSRISFRYFIVELLTGLLAVLLYSAFGLSAKFFAYSVFICALIVATFVDFDIQEIPDEISIGGTVLGLILALAMPSLFDTASRYHSVLASFIGAVVGGGSIYAMGVLGTIVFKKDAMGGGDVKLMAMIGAFLGWKLVMLTFFIAPLSGAIVGIILRMKDGREIIPYGPHLSLAAVIVMFFGSRILNVFLYGLF